MNKNKRKIELQLNHNYLKITEGTTSMMLPIRCAKLIKDMYNIRNAENEKDDIKHYSSDEYHNAEYHIDVHIMNAEFNSELNWISTVIKPFNLKNKIIKPNDD